MTIQDSAQVIFGAGLDLNGSSAAPNQTALNLNGGSLTVGAFSKTSLLSTQLTTVNFNGGILRAGATTTTFLPALNGLTANVQSGGAKIDTNGFDIILRLANSASALWAPATLTIAGWSGLVDGQGQDEIFFGTGANGLTALQLSQVRFLDPLGFAPGIYSAKLLPTGELVVIPEPGGIALLLAGAGSLMVRRRYGG
jgi:hypothetical protein